MVDVQGFALDFECEQGVDVVSLCGVEVGLRVREMLLE